MTNRLDIVCPRKGNDGRDYFTKIGVAFETRNGGWSLSFEALPLPSIGENGKLECRALLMPPRERDDRAPPQHRQPAQQQRGRGGFDDLDDPPF